MYDNLKLVINNSYSPFSKYRVACIVKCKDNQEFVGVNIENPSVKSGLCAEQVAIGSAVSEGYKKGDFDSLYLLGSGKEVCRPCFLCRQLLVEFFDAEDKVICYNSTGKEEQYLVKDLCPYAFDFEPGDKNGK